MRIAINCRSFLGLKSAGIGRYAKSLVQCLAAMDRVNDYILYCRLGIFDRKRRLPEAPADNFRVKADYLGLGLDLTVGRFDLYHTPSPEVLRTKTEKIVASVADLIHRTYPQSHTPETIDLSERAFQSVVARAQRFICISESTRQDLYRFYPSTRGRAVVVYNGVDGRVFYRVRGAELAKAQDVLRGHGIRERFILFVGTIEPRKNLANLLRAFAALKAAGDYSGCLVVAGMKGWMSEGLGDELARLGISKDTIFLGYLTDQELRYLYNLTDVFVYPSFYEGFGYPVVEAMACGAAVVTSNTSCLGEVAGDAALTVDPSSVDAIAKAIGRLVADQDLGIRLREKAILRAREFSFERTAKETLAVYEECVKAA